MHKQVEMIGHKAVCPNRDGRLFGESLRELQLKPPVVVVVPEYFTPIDATVVNVVDGIRFVVPDDVSAWHSR